MRETNYSTDLLTVLHSGYPWVYTMGVELNNINIKKYLENFSYVRKIIYFIEILLINIFKIFHIFYIL